MSKTCNTFFSFLFSKYVKLMLSLFICFFILFNSVSTTFSFVYNNIDLEQVGSIQKDILSAVFTVSSIINKINSSVVSNISSTKTKNKTDSTPVQKSNNQNNDIISITCNNYNTSNVANNVYNINFQYLTSNLTYYNQLYNVKFVSILIVYLLTMLCLFASTIKIFDILKNTNIERHYFL